MKKLISILLALCLMVLCLPVVTGSGTAYADELPAPTIAFEKTEFNLEEQIGNFRITVPKPTVEGYRNFQCRMEIIDGSGENVCDFWYGQEEMQEEDGKLIKDDFCWYTTVLSGQMTARVNYEYEYDKVDEQNPENVWSEWANSPYGKQTLTVRKGGALGALTIEPAEALYAGRAMRLRFSFTGDVSCWDDENNTPIDPRVTYSVVKKDTGESVGIAARNAVPSFTARLFGWGPWEGDPEGTFRYGTEARITEKLEAGTYVVKAKPFDKRGNHDAGQEVTKEFTVDEEPFNGITISSDQESYRVGEKATITVHHDKAKTIGLNVWAPDEKGWVDLGDVEAKDGTVTYTTGELLSPWWSDVGCHVYAINGNGVDEEFHRSVMNPLTGLTADKEEYVAGDTAKLELDCYKAKMFRVWVEYHHADGSRDYDTINLDADANGKATCEIYMAEKQTVSVNAQARFEVPGSEDLGYADNSTPILLNVIEKGAAPIEVARPTGLKITTANGTAVKLTWKKASGAQTYIIERKTGDDEFAMIGEVKTTSYTDKKAKAGTGYIYRVIAAATNEGGELFASKPSAAKSFMILAKADKPTVKSEVSKQLTATWKKVAKAEYYEIYYATSKKAPKYTAKATATETGLSLTVDGLKAKKTYYVFVRAVRELDNGTVIRGPWSAAGKVKIKK